ncbi:MAG TPA: heparan-alpha-glucosaminide N-acetyltransferase domain-containing protein [Candidatus Acidoferrum sp.]|nr:heparan-alpha-glucosaminide N-acetyltransferase domain-containing protein [Candidatus Acidoferrum sp.]
MVEQTNSTGQQQGRSGIVGRAVLPSNIGRLTYIDWMRGLACVLMFQTHCYDSWLSPEARKSSSLINWSQLGGTLPAPLFIFLAGVSFALVTERLREKGVARNTIAKQTILRGAEIFGMGLLFRVQEFALGYPWSPWTDLLRVDVLNILGLSMMLMGVLCWATGDGAVAVARIRTLVAGLFVAAVVALATPPLWTTHRPKFLPWPLESYINGVHIFDKPQAWLFPLFPWSAFAFAGLAAGFYLFSDFAKRKEGLAFALLGGTGVLACWLSTVFDSSRVRLYAVYDYWHSNPDFLLMRCGILLIILFLVYAWCRWGFAQKGFSPIVQLGNTSLLVYWVHIEFVYGRFSILPKGRCSAWKATAGLLTIFAAMVLLSVARTAWKKRKPKGVRPGLPATAATAES